MPHRAETIMAAIEAALTNTDTVIENVNIIDDLDSDTLITDGSVSLLGVLAGDILVENITGISQALTGATHPNLFVADNTLYSNIYPRKYTVVRGSALLAGYDVKMSRVYEVVDAELPALTINMGADEISNDGNMAVIDRLLNIEITAHIKATANIDTALNRTRREVHQAIYADTTLGESFVSKIVSNGDDEPEFSGELETAVASQKLNYIVHYRHSVADPGL